jgi:hypothetical protein
METLIMVSHVSSSVRDLVQVGSSELLTVSISVGVVSFGRPTGSTLRSCCHRYHHHDQSAWESLDMTHGSNRLPFKPYATLPHDGFLFAGMNRYDRVH